MSLVMDHVIILVDDLERASADFEALGFTVTPGGEHGEGLTHNALIHFADGTFFELFAYKRGWRASVLRWLYRAGALGFLARSRGRGGLFRFIELTDMPEGLVDFCLLADSLKAATDATEQANLPTPDPLSSSRVRPDGQEVRWDIISILTPALPFLRSPYAPSIAPDPQATRHDNGARGIARLQIESRDPATLTQLYAQLLGTAPLTGTQEHGEVTAFRAGSGVLEIVESEPRASASPRTRVRPRALRSLTLKAPPGTAARTLDLARTHGANIDLVATDSV
jgi:catechol 2,3-dioxygenase-like lactoylglutathione lyase family enzyme